jgi:hypothetical protein
MMFWLLILFGPGLVTMAWFGLIVLTHGFGLEK